MSETKTTTELQAPPEWAIGLKREIVDGFRDVTSRLDQVEANVSALVDDKRITNDRLSRIEAWKENEVMKRLDATSDRVRETSQADIAHDAAIAAIKVEVEKLAARPDTGAQVLAAVEALGSKPLVKRVTSAAVPVLLLAISVIGVMLQTKLAKLQESPPSPPTIVYVPAAADGGAR